MPCVSADFDQLMEDPKQMDDILQQGAQKAKSIADGVLARDRSRLGLLKKV